METIFEQGNVKVTENIVDNTPPTVFVTTPSGEATCAKEVKVKVKGTKTTLAVDIDSPTKILAIDTCQVEKKSIIEMSPTELMMLATKGWINR